MKRIATCCFTGHRPEKLNVPIEIVLEKLEKAIEDAFSDGFTDYITGMSRGVDIWAAEKVLDMKKEFPHIRLICAIPFNGFEKEWEQGWQDRYQRILQQADEIHYICNRYIRWVHQKRKAWMIDHASMVIACYTGVAGGTQHSELSELIVKKYFSAVSTSFLLVFAPFFVLLKKIVKWSS